MRKIIELLYFDYLVQNLFPSNFFGNCDIEEERKSFLFHPSNLFSYLQGRLMYVAITRAKRYLHMSYSQTRSSYGQEENCRPSQFISEIPSKLVHIYNENDEIYQPPKKKMTIPTQHGFITGKNLLNVVKWNKKK
jgi:superfamily I DNA/RNA helicase